MEDAFEHIAGDVPDVVLNDIGLPGMSGIDGIRILKERHPGLLVLMLTIYDDDERIFDALCAGASGHLLKHTQPARLLEALRAATARGPSAPWAAGPPGSVRKNTRPGRLLGAPGEAVAGGAPMSPGVARRVIA